MKTYLEINVPIKYDDPWFEELRNHFAGIPVKWQKDFYHITMVFVNVTPKGIDLCPLLKKHLMAAQAPELTFDQLDAFATRSGMYIIHMSTSHIPEHFLSLTEAIRADMKTAGCVIQSDFILHVTLGRLSDFNIALPKLRSLTQSFSIPPLSMTLTDVDYRVYRGKTIFETQLRKILVSAKPF